MTQDENLNCQVTIRRFEFDDIPNKVKWINNPLVNRYLHYDLPLEIKKTEEWFIANQNRNDRFDAVILVDGDPVGLIGLLSIDYKKRNAEYYIAIGEPEWVGKGIATRASLRLLEYAFGELALNSIYLSAEHDNKKAVRLYDRMGFKRDHSLEKTGSSLVYYKFDRADYSPEYITPICLLNCGGNNKIYIKRDDLLPFSFGGNKSRKATKFFREIENGNHSCVVTYGSSSSNHCRVVANMAAERKMPCYIVSPLENAHETNNLKMIKLFGAKIITAKLSEVHDTIESLLCKLTEKGERPYFIAGGGHGVIGTSAYVDCYWEVKHYEKVNHIYFDDIFFASGTGTTHSGLVCGQILANDERNIVGISIARKNPRGRDVVVDSVNEYLSEKKIDCHQGEADEKTHFCDDYTGEGYAKSSEEINNTIERMLINNGVPFDSVYTGKAFYGMLDYLEKNNIKDHRVLFIHTGGTPLFFDYLADKKI